MCFCVYAYLDEEIVVVLLAVCRNSGFSAATRASSASSAFVCVCLRELHLFGNQTGST